MSTKKRNTLLVLAAVGFVAICFLFWISRRNSEQGQKIAALESQNKKLATMIEGKQDRLNAEAEASAQESSNEKVRLGAQQQLAVDRAIETNKELFAILLTYNNSKEYKARKSDSSPYFTDDAKTKTLFVSDDFKGSSEIDAFGLHSKFVSCDTSVGTIDKDGYVTTVTIAKFESWFTDEARGIGKDIYVGKFDYTNQQYVSLERINNFETYRKQ